MRIGLQFGYFNLPTPQIGPMLGERAHAADEAGFDSLWVMDHFFQMEPWGGPQENMLEGYTTLGYLAGLTRRARLGLMVTGVTYRKPGFLIKTVTTLDVLSSGRAYLGIGAAWYEREARALGFDFPPRKERFEWLKETLQIAHRMWRDDASAFEGQHFRLENPVNRPMPLSQPHPPILIGGEGEKKTLRFVAQYGDACNIFAYQGMDFVRGKLEVLRAHCEDLGRDYASIEKTSLSSVHLAPGAQNPADIIHLCEELRGAGIEHAIFNMPNAYEPGVIEDFAEKIIPAVHAL